MNFILIFIVETSIYLNFLIFWLNIFVANTLSLQNKNKLKSLNIEFLELKNNQNSIAD